MNRWRLEKRAKLGYYFDLWIQMDTKKFADWMELSGLYDQQQRLEDLIKGISEEKLRKILNVFKLSEFEINYYIEHREKIAEQLFDIGCRIEKPTH